MKNWIAIVSLPIVTLALPAAAQNANVVQGLLGGGANTGATVNAGSAALNLGVGLSDQGLSLNAPDAAGLNGLAGGGFPGDLPAQLRALDPGVLDSALGSMLPAGDLPPSVAVPAGALDIATLQSVLNSGLASLPASSLPADLPLPVSSLAAVNPRVLLSVVDGMVPAGALPADFPVLTSAIDPAQLQSLPAGLLPADAAVPLSSLDLPILLGLLQSAPGGLPGLE